MTKIPFKNSCIRITISIISCC